MGQKRQSLRNIRQRAKILLKGLSTMSHCKMEYKYKVRKRVQNAVRDAGNDKVFIELWMFNSVN